MTSARTFLALLAVYYVVVAYPPARALAVWGGPGALGPWLLAAIFCLPACGWLVHQRWRNPLTRFGLRVVFTWAGLAFLLCALLLPWEVVNLLSGVDPADSMGVVLVVFAGLAGFALANAFRLVRREVTVRSARLDRSLRCVQVSDLHVGSRGVGWLRRVVRRIVAERPDAVFVTGDLIDLRNLPETALAPMGDLVRGVDGPVFFAIGNHERYIGSDRVCAVLERHGVVVLRDRATEAAGIRVIGIDDAEDRGRVAEVLAGLELAPGPFTVLLYHRPDGFEAAAAAGVDLMLCGHTHNGQIVPFNWLVRRHFPRTVGRFGHAGSTLYVSPGTGTWGPLLRLGSVNELTVLRLSPEDADGDGRVADADSPHATEVHEHV